jgi:hypothetical protein
MDWKSIFLSMVIDMGRTDFRVADWSMVKHPRDETTTNLNICQLIDNFRNQLDQLVPTHLFWLRKYQTNSESLVQSPLLTFRTMDHT